MSKTVGSQTTYYLYHGDALIAEVDASTDQVIKSYTWGVDGLVSDHAGTQSRFYLFDALGNAQSLLDPNGNLIVTAAYTVYGTPIGTPLPSTPFRVNDWLSSYLGRPTSGFIPMGIRSGTIISAIICHAAAYASIHYPHETARNTF